MAAEHVAENSPLAIDGRAITGTTATSKDGKIIECEQGEGA
ncbi:hypothetical protein J2S98_001053 [Arthrobacter oryzae]|uniref:Uncharacterized protein n=1 Tax=Paenarthrobacter aurescens (strain TC1) TaxID=290340 RepID=A1R4K2_PAEAT|nr:MULTISPECIES: hypothetical protein [Micrococcaceae]ABM07365.1 hypothetical protein AAur_1390 [Paenarthrobacter aurescens TC1]MDP9985908.1 hypothetical protein [Arthrobacter oryzae]